MNTITNNEFIQSVLETAAWKEISGSQALSMDIIEKYVENLDWDEISENGNILWTLDGLRKYAKKLDWNKLSRYSNSVLMRETTLREFKNKWNWSELSKRHEIINNWELLEKFADDIDWGNVINDWGIDRPVEFLRRFEKHIPMAKLLDSSLWSRLVSDRSEELIQEIINQ